MFVESKIIIVIGAILSALFAAAVIVAIVDVIKTYRHQGPPSDPSEIRSRYLFNIFQAVSGIAIVLGLAISASQLGESAGERRMRMFHESAEALELKTSSIRWFTAGAIVSNLVDEDPERFGSFTQSLYIAAIRDYAKAWSQERAAGTTAPEVALRLERLISWLSDLRNKTTPKDQEMGPVDLRKISLEGFSFKNLKLVFAELSDSDFSQAKLLGADFTCDKLENTNFREAKLTGAYFSCADMRHANLEGATLVGAHLEQADLTGAGLRRTQLPGATLTCAILDGADLSEAKVDPSALESAQISFATILPVGLR